VPVALERRDDFIPGGSETPVALAEVAFIFPSVGQARTHEITGTAPDQQPRDRLRVRVNRF
jgi:hypothetical protein